MAYNIPKTKVKEIMKKRDIKKVKSNEYVSFYKYSLVKHKTYKNTFDKMYGLDVISDEEGKHFLVDANGTIYTTNLKWYDEVNDVEINKKRR